MRLGWPAAQLVELAGTECAVCLSQAQAVAAAGRSLHPTSIAADLSSLTSLSLKYVQGGVLPPEGHYLSRLQSLRVVTFNQVGRKTSAECGV